MSTTATEFYQRMDRVVGKSFVTATWKGERVNVGISDISARLLALSLEPLPLTRVEVEKVRTMADADPQLYDVTVETVHP